MHTLTPTHPPTHIHILSHRHTTPQHCHQDDFDADKRPCSLQNTDEDADPGDIETVIEFKLDGVQDTGQPATPLAVRADPKILAGEDTRTFVTAAPCSEDSIEIQVFSVV